MLPWRKRSPMRWSAGAVFKPNEAKPRDKRVKAVELNRRKTASTPAVQDERVRDRPFAKAPDGIPVFRSPLALQRFAHAEHPPHDQKGQRKEEGAVFEPLPDKHPRRPLLKNVFARHELKDGDFTYVPAAPDQFQRAHSKSDGQSKRVGDATDNPSRAAGQTSGNRTNPNTRPSFSSDLESWPKDVDHQFLTPSPPERVAPAATNHCTDTQVCSRHERAPSSGSNERSVDRRERRVRAVRAIPMLTGNDAYQQKLEVAADRFPLRRRGSTPQPRTRRTEANRAFRRKLSLPTLPLGAREQARTRSPPSVVDEADEPTNSSGSNSYSAEVFAKIAAMRSSEDDPNEIKGFDTFMMY